MQMRFAAPRRARAQRLREFTQPWIRILKAEIVGYILPSESTSLHDEPVENERTASEALSRNKHERVGEHNPARFSSTALGTDPATNSDPMTQPGAILNKACD